MPSYVLIRIVTNETYFYEVVRAEIKFRKYLLPFISEYFVFGIFTPKFEDEW
jgi:hypothetical protein